MVNADGEQLQTELRNVVEALAVAFLDVAEGIELVGDHWPREAQLLTAENLRLYARCAIAVADGRNAEAGELLSSLNKPF